MCNLEFPDLERVRESYEARGLRILGIAGTGLFGGETEETLTLFQQQTGVTFPIVWDLDRSYSAVNWPPAAPPVSPYPRQALVDPSGVIVYVASEHQGAALEAAIEANLP